jgi:hypothetical protein
MRTETINIYKIDEHPSKDKCFEWIRNNEYHHIGDYEVDELVCSIKKLSEAIGGTNDWSIAHYPCRGEHITFKDYDEDLLEELNADECPLTGCFWDIEVINALKAKDMGKVLDTLHECVTHLYSDEALEEMCEANDYEFYESGKVV